MQTPLLDQLNISSENSSSPQSDIATETVQNQTVCGLNEGSGGLNEGTSRRGVGTAGRGGLGDGAYFPPPITEGTHTLL